MLSVKINDNVFFTGSNDRRTALFENHWPLENGVSYNSYLITDQKTALIDTVEAGQIEDLLNKIKSLLSGRTLDYLVINHMEPDHSAAIRALVREYPEIQLVGNSKTFPLLEGFYGNFNHKHTVAEGEILDLGKHQLTFYMMPMVHWPESMVTFDKTSGILFSNDAFGGFGALDGGIFDYETDISFYEPELRRYYSNIVGKYGNQVQKIMEKVAGLDVKIIAPSHGLLWKEKIPWIIEKYHDWSTYKASKGVVIVYGSLYGNTGKTADAIARYLAEEGIKHIRVFDASKTHISHIISYIWEYQGLVIGTAAYNGSIFSPVSHIMHHFKNVPLKNRIVGLFGNACWGSAVRELKKMAEECQLDLVMEPSESKCTPKDQDFEYARQLAKAMAKKLGNN